MALHINLLGHLQVSEDNTSIADKLRPRAKHLLIYVLLNRNIPVSREKIAFTLWPDKTEQQSLAVLRRALSELRIALPKIENSEWIISIGGDLCWDLDSPYWLDIEEYQRLIEIGSVISCEKAIYLYTGDLLSNFWDEWIVIEREQIRQTQITTLNQLISHYRALGKYHIAMDMVQRLISLEPLSESAHRQLMTLHYLSNDRPSALTVYDRLCELLRDELDIEPLDETQQLRNAIRKGKPIHLETDFQRKRAKHISNQSLVVPIGREPEAACIANLWEKASSGHGRLVFVSGEAGVGKSHIVEYLSKYTNQNGGLALVGHCYEFEKALPFQSILEILRTISDLLPYSGIQPTHRAALARIAPEILGAMEPTTHEDMEEGELRIQIFKALWHTFLALAQKQALVLVVEDAHWASDSTLDWFTYIANEVISNPILVVVTYRSGDIDASHTLKRLQRRLQKKEGVATIQVNPLSRSDHRKLVEKVSGLTGDQSESVSDRLYKETGGNPLFLEELIRGLIESGQINISNNKWEGHFVTQTSQIPIPLPDTLRETFNSRVERLPEISKEFIQCAATTGRVFEFEIVLKAGGWTTEIALKALDNLLAREYIRPDVKGSFVFRHHLVREAIYDELPIPRQRNWHCRIGDAIETIYPNKTAYIADLAHHFFQGQVWEKAAYHAILAAERAEMQYADTEAILFYDQALDAIQQLPNSDIQQQFDCLTKRLRAEERQGDIERITITLAKMEELARASNDKTVLAGALLNRGRFLRLVGPIPEGLTLLEECSQLCEELNNQELLAAALTERGQAHFARLHIREAMADLQQAASIYRDGSTPNSEQSQLNLAITLRALGNLISRTADFQTAIDSLEESLSLLEALEVPRLDEIALTKLELGWVHQGIGGTPQQASILTDAVETLRRINMNGFTMEAHLLEMAIRLGLGDQPLDEARSLIKSLDRWQGRPDVKGMRLGLLAWYELFSGHPEAALDDVQEAISLFQQAGDLNSLLLTLPVLILVHMQLGNLDLALEFSAEALELLGDSKHYVELTLNFAYFQVLVAVGRSDEAQVYLQRSYQALIDRTESLREPELREASLEFPFNAQVLATWESSQKDPS